MRRRLMRWNVNVLCGILVFLADAVCKAAEVVASTNCTNSRNGALLDSLAGELFSYGSDPRYYFSACGLSEVSANASTTWNHSMTLVRISRPDNRTVASRRSVERFYSPEAPLVYQNRLELIKLVKPEDGPQVLCLILLTCGKKNFSIITDYNETKRLLLFDLAHPKFCETRFGTAAASILAICFFVLLVFCLVVKSVYHRTCTQSVPRAAVCGEACGCCRRVMGSRRSRGIETWYTRIPTSPPDSPMEPLNESKHSAAKVTTGPNPVVFEHDPQDDLLIAL